MEKNKHNCVYNGMLVYADHDRTQVGLRIVCEHKIWYNKQEDFVFLEGKIPSIDKINSLPDSKEKELFENLLRNKKNKYFVIIDKDFSEDLLKKYE